MEDPSGISIQPGQLYLAREPAVLQTILGSCVGVTFWCARLGAGALCHGVLPRCPRNLVGSEAHRYVDFSIRYLAQQFDALGACREELVVKLFGGADVLPVAESRSAKPTVGALNCQTALEVLQEERLQVAASDLGGDQGRTIHFHTETGDVFVHRLLNLNSAARRERDPSRLKRNRKVHS